MAHIEPICLKINIKNAKHKKYEPNEYLIKEGSYQRDVFFIRKGNSLNRGALTFS